MSTVNELYERCANQGDSILNKLSVRGLGYEGRDRLGRKMDRRFPRGMRKNKKLIRLYFG